MCRPSTPKAPEPTEEQKQPRILLSRERYKGGSTSALPGADYILPARSGGAGDRSVVGGPGGKASSGIQVVT